jgi:ABC-2 type transport system permease protein
MLQYQLAHAFRLLTQTASKRILFPEGHGEFPDEQLNEMLDYLSYEYAIDRGTLPADPSALDSYDAVVIAGPQLPFPEQDKFILDQYLMQGGSLLWFVNGVRIHSYDELAQQGETLSMDNDLNLNDLFFTYGLRIQPVLLQDMQSLSIPVVLGDTLDRDYVEKPWYYAVLLQPNDRSEITKGLSWIKTEFASTITFTGDRPNRREVLLTSSPHAHSVPVPARISLEEADRKPDPAYFNESHLPVAVGLSGIFPSAFNNRNSFHTGRRFLKESQPAKIIVVASENIIGDGGYDRYSQMQFANKAFVMNVLNFLTDNEGISALKNKSLQLQLLNKQRLQQDSFRVIWFNVVLPPAIIWVLFVILLIMRRRKYGKQY